MKKPLHWSKKNIGHENSSILSTVALLHPDICMYIIEYTELDKEELDSILWGIWEGNEKKLRPSVYKIQKMFYKLMIRIMKK